MADEKSNGSSKRLVKILVIVGIGVPVLIELMTLFNLINVQLFEDKKNGMPQDARVSDTRGFGEGDTLFIDEASAIIVNPLRVKVSAQEWRFALGLFSADSSSQDELQVEVDSLVLQSNKILTASDNSVWEVKQDLPAHVYGEWILPNGDIPQKLYISVNQRAQENSKNRRSQEVSLDNIPVRYNQK